MKMRNEAALIDEVLNGKEDRFEILMYPYRDGLLNMARRLAGNLDDAYEICQEVLIKVYRYLRSFDKSKSFKSWIYRIMINTANDFIKKNCKLKIVRLEVENVHLPHNICPEKNYLQEEFKCSVGSFLARLTGRERAVYLLREVGGFNIKETARILKCSSVSTRVHLTRARKKIHRYLKDLYLFDNEVKNAV